LDLTTAAVAVIVAGIAAVPGYLAWRTGQVNAKLAAAAVQAALDAKTEALAAATLAAEARSEIVQTKDGVFELGKRVDGRLEELLLRTSEAAEARGVASGIASERADPQSPRMRDDEVRSIGFRAGQAHERYRPGEDAPLSGGRSNAD